MWGHVRAHTSHNVHEAQARPTHPLASVPRPLHLYPLDLLAFPPLTALSPGKIRQEPGAPSVITSSFCGPVAHTFGSGRGLFRQNKIRPGALGDKTAFLPFASTHGFHPNVEGQVVSKQTFAGKRPFWLFFHFFFFLSF